MEALLANITFEDWLILGLIAAIIILAILVISLERRVTRLTRGQGAKSLEEVVNTIHARLEQLRHNHETTSAYLEKAEERIAKGTRGIGVVRFNPFQSGDGQSFAAAFLNEKGDGVIISTLSLRERVSVFAKPVKNYTSPHELTEEEQAAMRAARES